MILASSGIIASQIASFDADALAFFARVTTAGGTLSTTEKNAVNQLVLDLKANSLWTPMKAIYPMVGASAAACAQNLKSSSFTGTFTSGWTFASTGATPNGTSTYMNTNLNLSTQLTFNSTCITYYSRSNTATGNKSEMGCVNDVVDYLPLITLEVKRTDAGTTDRFVSCVYSYLVDGVAKLANADSRGFYISTRTSSTSLKAFKNNSLLIANTSTQLQPNYPNANMYLAALNTIGAAISQFSDRECAFSSIGDGLTDTQASNFYTAVQSFQTTLSRQV